MFSINRILNSAFSTRTKTLAPEPSPTQRTNMFPPGPTLMCLPNTHTSILIAYKQPQTLPCEKNQPIACTSHTPNAQIDNQITLNHFSATPPRHLCIHDATMSPEKIAPNTSAAEQNNSPKQKKDHSLTPRQKQALKYGFIYPNGTPNLPALARYQKDRKALALELTQPDGSPNITALGKYQNRKPGPALMCLPNTHTSILIAYKQAQTLPCEKNQPIACTSRTPNAQIDNQITLNHFSATPPRHLCIHDATMSPEKIAPNTSAAEQNNSPKQKKDHSLTPRQKQALKYGFIYPNGTPNLPTLARYQKDRKALALELTHPDGSPNLPALARSRKQNTALKRGFTHPDGSPNVPALEKYQKEKTALKRGFIHPDGSPNLTQFQRDQFKKRAAKAGFINADGSANPTALRRQQRQDAAVKRGFTYPDGSPNLTQLHREHYKKRALKHGFQNPDGTANVSQFQHEEYKKGAVKAGFVHADGSPNTAAYARHLNQKYQRHINRSSP